MLLRIQSENSEHFLGAVEHLLATGVPCPTAGVGQFLRFGQIAFAPLQVGGSFHHFVLEFLVGLAKLLLCPSSHGADPADSQGAKYAKGQINEISIANWTEGTKGK